MTTTSLPVIVSFGGYNAAGRSSFHQAFKRTVIDSLNPTERRKTLLGLACLMKLVSYEEGNYQLEGSTISAEEIVEKFEAYILENTLIRKIREEHFDVKSVPGNRDLHISAVGANQFTLPKRDLPNPTPSNWNIVDNDDKTVTVTVEGDMQATVAHYRECEVQTAGQLPSGFNPAEHYSSRFHPRGLQLAVLGASDAINALGIPWETVINSVAPDEIAVYATSAMGQADQNGQGGLMKARLQSGRVSSKQLAFGLTSMPTDFVNAYVCGNVGATGSMAGACASFLFNLRLAVDDIKSGRRRVVMVGSAEAPLVPEIIEGYSAMGALATVERLAKLDGVSEQDVDHSRASRPFANNVGFTLGESSQYCILMDDALALELGATIHGAVNDVFVNADGFKKSISSPGAGNYLTLAKAVASARAILGEDSIKQRSFVHSHGSSTPQNRVTESMVLDKVASGFDIDNWPITAAKAYVGHPTGPASGDQLVSALGTFKYGIVPGIRTVDKVADDIYDDRLDILLQDKFDEMDVCFLNTKGFGGNNASASVLSANVAKTMMENRHGADNMQAYEQKNADVQAAAADYERTVDAGELNVIYNFGNGIIDEEALQIDADSLHLAEFKQAVSLQMDNPFADMSR